MNASREEKTALIILAALLLTGSLILHVKNSGSRARVAVRPVELREELSVAEVDRRLKEARRIDVNTADKKQLMRVPGIGDVLAERVLSYRQAHGGFASETDLLGVEGIGPKKFERIREYIKIE